MSAAVPTEASAVVWMLAVLLANETRIIYGIAILIKKWKKLRI
jgi:hypothetical protein